MTRRKENHMLAWIGIFVAGTMLILLAWAGYHNNAHLNNLVEDLDKQRQAEIQNAYTRNYVLCRSIGYGPKQCRTIARGVVLEQVQDLDVETIDAKLATLGEAQVQKLFVTSGKPQQGKQGKQGKIGIQGRQGPRGAPGATGSTGARGTTGATGNTGPKGDKGDRGPRGRQGANGAVGPRGATGPPGPAGIVCPGMRIVTITIPSQGTFKIPVCP